MTHSKARTPNPPTRGDTHVHAQDYLEEPSEKIDFPSSGNLQISLANGNIMKIPLTSINISEEVNKSGIWKQVNDGNCNNESKQQQQKQPKMINVGKSKKHSKKDGALLLSDEMTRLTTMTEEDDEDDSGISIKVDLIRSKDSCGGGPFKPNGTTSAETSV